MENFGEIGSKTIYTSYLFYHITTGYPELINIKILGGLFEPSSVGKMI